MNEKRQSKYGAWFGVTYKKDKSSVAESIKKLIQNKVYREELYSDL
ncbi:hypothetical protein [Ruminococcus sp. 5_1_39BFAA]